MTKFKVGDKVRRLESRQDSWWCKTCEINSVSPKGTFEVSKAPDECGFMHLKEIKMIDSRNLGLVELDRHNFELAEEFNLSAELPKQAASYCEVCTERFSQCRCFETKESVKISDDGVKSPSHYMLFDDIEAIEVIARSMSVAQFKGYCLGNILKYRLHAGKKSELATLEKDLAKASFYQELFDKHKSKCYDHSSIGVKNCVVNL